MDHPNQSERLSKVQTIKAKLKQLKLNDNMRTKIAKLEFELKKTKEGDPAVVSDPGGGLTDVPYPLQRGVSETRRTNTTMSSHRMNTTMSSHRTPLILVHVCFSCV